MGFNSGFKGLQIRLGLTPILVEHFSAFVTGLRLLICVCQACSTNTLGNVVMLSSGNLECKNLCQKS